MGRELASAAARWIAPGRPRRPARARRASATRAPRRSRWFERLDPRAAARRPTTATCSPTTRSTSSTSPSRTTCTRSSTSPRSRPASTSSARSRSASTSPPNERDHRRDRASPALSCAARREMPFFPGGQAVARCDRRARASAACIEVRSQFLHSSDLDPGKPINWKRVSRAATASTAAWATSGCTRSTCRCAPAGGRATSRADPLERRHRAARTRTASRCPATPGTTPSCSARPSATGHRSRCGSRRSGSRPARRTPGRSRSTAPQARSPTRRSSRRRSHGWTTSPGGPQVWRVTDLGSESAVPDDHRRDLRVRLLRRDPPDVGRLLRRARARPRRDAAAVPLRDARGGGGDAPAVHGGAALARGVCDGCPVTETYGYRFSFGPWNIHEGADPFGPTVRPSRRSSPRSCGCTRSSASTPCSSTTTTPCRTWTSSRPAEIAKQAPALQQDARRRRAWWPSSSPRGCGSTRRRIDGGYTANDPQVPRLRHRARRKTAVDIANALGTDLIVLWLAREGTYIRESKNAIDGASHRLVEAINTMLAYDPNDHASPSSPSPTSRWTTPTSRPSATPWPSPRRRSTRTASAALIETAHAHAGRPRPVGRDGLRPRARQAVERAPERPERPEVRPGQDVRRGQPPRGLQPGARARTRAGYGSEASSASTSKAMRTQPAETRHQAPAQQPRVFLRLVELSRTLDRQAVAALIAARDYEELDWLILSHLTGAATE